MKILNKFKLSKFGNYKVDVLYSKIENGKYFKTLPIDNIITSIEITFEEYCSAYAHITLRKNYETKHYTNR